MAYTRVQLVEKLKSYGVVFTEFSLTQEGHFTAKDGRWNYVDLPHIPNVHKALMPFFSIERNDFASGIYFMNFAGFRICINNTVYEPKPNTMTYHTTFLFFVLVVETVFDEIEPIHTIVTTTYSIGTPKLLKWCALIMKFCLTRTFNYLMSGDIPMRERRGQLRTWGYQFRADGDHFTFKDSLDIYAQNVIYPDDNGHSIDQVDIGRELPGDGELLLGKSDHVGLRIRRTGSRLFIYPRSCPHEGACMDTEKIPENRILRCPWHNRPFRAVAMMDLDDPKKQIAKSEHHQIILEGKMLKVQTIPLQEQQKSEV